MRRERIGKNILTVLFVLISIAYMMPIVVVLFNSFKSNACHQHQHLRPAQRGELRGLGQLPERHDRRRISLH